MNTQGTRDKLICSFCGKTFKYFSNLDIHMRVHTHEKPFDCRRCSYSATQYGNIKQHIWTHTGEKPYQCHVCKKTFHHSNHMRLHLRSHTGEKPHKCELCGKRFTQLCTLQCHIRTHTLEKPYKCEICNKSFTQSSNMRTHQATIHNINRDHFMVKCVFCTNHVFSQSVYFRHIGSHIHERPHFCRFCSREFDSKSRTKNYELNVCKKKNSDNCRLAVKF